MGWERRRGGRQYYFRARRDGTRVLKTYVGGGPKAQLAAQEDKAARDARQHEAQFRTDMECQVAELAAILNEFGELADQVVSYQLFSAGWRKHHREWRHGKCLR